MGAWRGGGGCSFQNYKYQITSKSAYTTDYVECTSLCIIFEFHLFVVLLLYSCRRKKDNYVCSAFVGVCVRGVCVCVCVCVCVRVCVCMCF